MPRSFLDLPLTDKQREIARINTRINERNINIKKLLLANSEDEKTIKKLTQQINEQNQKSFL